ncbi:MAG: imidazole glycerol phosphate synthase subunit HisH [Chloroflexi bacterium]|nr:imidazole glycerol phosphate synthase subunit HisH [Chloroflexota bacterium]
MIAVIDYGAGNLRSVANAIARLGYQPRITSAARDLLKAQAIILPGVGAAGNTMENLRNLGLVDLLKKLIADNRPFFGVCIGLQVLFTGTEEGGWHNCLGIIPGRVKKLPDGLKVPHMGWNQVRQRVSHPLFEGIPDGADFYFVHSYYGEPEDNSLVVGETDYGITMGSVIARDNLVATQFHPEKSGEHGLKMYDNFIRRALATRTP